MAVGLPGAARLVVGAVPLPPPPMSFSKFSARVRQQGHRQWVRHPVRLLLFAAVGFAFGQRR